MGNKFGIRALAWILITAISISLTTPAMAQAEVVEDFTPRRIMIKREHADKAEDYSVSFFRAYEQAEETEITEGLTVMDAGMYDLYSLYYDASVVAIEDDAPLYAMGNFITEDSRILEVLGIDSLRERGLYGENVKVAVLDTAIEYVQGMNIAGRVSFLDDTQKQAEAPGDVLHGTAVAAVLSELAPMAELYSVEVLDENGTGYYSSLIQGIYWAVEHQMDVLVMSLGGESYSAFLREALLTASWHDMVVFAAAGNEDGGNILYPAAYPETLSVGAVDESSLPMCTYADGFPDLLAPGEVRLAECLDSMVFRGSSAATPVAAAAAVLLRGMEPDLSREQIMALLINTSDGVVDAETAVLKYNSPVYTRLTYRNAVLSELEALEAGLDGIMEAQTHVCINKTSYGPHTSSGHIMYYGCRICGNYASIMGVSAPGCSQCNSPKPTNTPKPTATPKPASTPKPTATPKPAATPEPTAIPEPTAAPQPTVANTPSPTPGYIIPDITWRPSKTPTPTSTPIPTLPADNKENNDANLGDEADINGAFALDPINMVTGNFYHAVTDMYFPGIGDAAIAITRNYNSVSSRNGLLGNGWSFTYDTNLSVLSDGDVKVVYASGRTLIFEKSGSNYLTPAVCQDTLTKNSNGTWNLVTEEKVTYTYNSGGKLTAVTDRNGNKVTLTYSGGSLSKITGADGVVLTVSCSGGKLRKITDPYGRTVNYSYDSSGNLTGVSGETCGTIHYTYNSYGMTSIKDGNGKTYLENTYDSKGRVTAQTDEEGGNFKILYNDKQQENTKIVVETGVATRYQYDENLYVTRINYADGSYEKYEYDDNGNRIMVRERSGYVTEYTYDSKDNMTSVTDALGNQYAYSYDASGNLTKAVSPLGAEVRFEYDTKGNLLKVRVLQENGTWAQSAYTYDSKGRVLSVTDAEGGKTNFTYGTGSQPVSAANSLGGTITYTYDSIGRKTAVTTDLGKTQYEYNNKDQIVSITAADGGVTKFVYDSIGNLTKLILPEQTEQAVKAGLSMEEAKGYTYTYDSLDRLIASASPEDAVSAYRYDMEGNVTGQSRPEYAGYTVEDEKSYLYTYDNVGNVVKVSAPDGGITTYGYDAAGNVTSVTYPDGQEKGASIQYTYDALNRITSVTDTLGKKQYQYAYDADGSMSSVTDAKGYTTWYKYSVNGNLLEVREPKKEEGGQVWYQIYRYTYNKNNQVLTAESSSEFVTQTSQPKTWDKVTYTYDAAGNVTSIKDSTGSEVQYSYNAYSQILNQKVINGVTDPVTTSYTYTNMGSIAESEGYRYAYDRNGNLTKVTTPTGAVTRYIYDDADRLIRTEEEVQVDNTLSLQDNSARIQLLDDREKLYPKNSFMCEAAVDLGAAAKGMEVVVRYEADLLTLESCVTMDGGVSVNTSTPGIIRLIKNGSTAQGEKYLCYFTFTVKEETTGRAYVAVAPESTITNSDGSPVL